MAQNNNQAGKGDKPRNCFSKKFKDNYDLINWTKNKFINTSVSDTEDYKEVCIEFVKNNESFANFKRNPIYNKILEHVSELDGQLYKNYLDINFPEFKNFLKIFKTNDEIGNPIKFNYSDIGDISPTTLRYIKVLSDLIRLYKSLDNFNIIEIGVGYGGQCKIINDYFNIRKYTLVDLPEVLELSQKYLNIFNIENLDFLNFNNLPNNKNYDLVISNYSFSELSKEMQNFYFENIINKSEHGYLTCNFISNYFNIDSYNLDEIKTHLHKNFSIIKEEPLTSENNIIIYW